MEYGRWFLVRDESAIPLGDLGTDIFGGPVSLRDVQLWYESEYGDPIPVPSPPAGTTYEPGNHI